MKYICIKDTYEIGFGATIVPKGSIVRLIKFNGEQESVSIKNCSEGFVPQVVHIKDFDRNFIWHTNASEVLFKKEVW